MFQCLIEPTEVLVAAEESDSSVAVYDLASGAQLLRIRVGLWPHEVALSPDGQTAYVSNFGLKDYDEHIGTASFSVSFIDLQHAVEKERLYTFVTCHARATIGLREQRPDLLAWQVNILSVFTAVYNDNLVPINVNSDTLPGLIRYGAIGAPDPEWYRVDKVRLRYIPSDFLWSLAFRPYSKTVVPDGGW